MKSISLLALVFAVGCSSATLDTADNRSPLRGATVVAKLDPRSGQLPIGIARRGTDVYAAFAPTGTIVRIDASGAIAQYAKLPDSLVDGQMAGAIAGLAFDTSGTLYAARTPLSKTSPIKPAIFKIPPGGSA